MAAAAPKNNDDEDEGWGDAGALLDWSDKLTFICAYS